jgi:hypothetical protein
MPAKSSIVKSLYFAGDRTEQWSFGQPGTAGAAVVPAGRVKGVLPLTGGALKGITLAIEVMVRLTWRNFGWNEETGVSRKTR